MVVDWREKAQQHWIEQLEYCARTFGEPTASDFIKSTDARIERICKFPESGTREPLLNDKEMVYRYVLVQKRGLGSLLFIKSLGCLLVIAVKQLDYITSRRESRKVNDSLVSINSQFFDLDAYNVVDADALYLFG